ncbi:MAG: MBL fold metallo-hydrolase [Deltaproteobacteria bacterium]|nr:MBL fold metallo-hydrolase [Deltaproteobacteria bacterium]
METLASGVLLVPLRTPTLPPATATNCLIVGERRVAVIEPATPFDDQRRVLDGQLEGKEVVAILLTHHHADHVGYAPELRERIRAPILAHRETARRLPFPVDRPIDDGAVVEVGDGLALEAFFTPGHAPGHLVFLERRSRIAYAGDMVAGTGTVLIDPRDGGHMGQYLASLERLRSIGASMLVPAHGPVLRDPEAIVEQYVLHRRMREGKVLAAIGRGATLGEVLRGAYDDTPKLLWPLALRSLEAHLELLVEEGRVLREGDYVRPVAVRTRS